MDLTRREPVVAGAAAAAIPAASEPVAFTQDEGGLSLTLPDAPASRRPAVVNIGRG